MSEKMAKIFVLPKRNTKPSTSQAADLMSLLRRFEEHIKVSDEGYQILSIKQRKESIREIYADAIVEHFRSGNPIDIDAVEDRVNFNENFKGWLL